MFAATAAALHKNVESAMQSMGTGFERTYHPDPIRNIIYQKRYLQYKKTGTCIENILLQYS
jgi:L-ribulokinase